MNWLYDWQEHLRSVYFHADFDGAVSAAMLLRWSREPDRVALFPVDYHLKASWAQRQFLPWSAVVDFLYHPDAYLWVDHHANPFVLPQWKEQFRSGGIKCWREGASCCPVVIQEMFGEIEPAGYFQQYVFWSDIIDSGGYRSPQEATDLTNPYLMASKVIGIATEAVQGEFPRLIAKFGIEDVLRCEPSIGALVESVSLMETQVRKHLRDMVSFDGVAVLFDQSEYEWPYQRYHPYLIYPDAGFVVGIYAKKSGFEVSLGVNPWKRSAPIHVGRICASLGGGGHARVGGVTTGSVVDARRIARELLRVVRMEIER